MIVVIYVYLTINYISISIYIYQSVACAGGALEHRLAAI